MDYFFMDYFFMGYFFIGLLLYMITSLCTTFNQAYKCTTIYTLILLQHYILLSCKKKKATPYK